MNTAIRVFALAAALVLFSAIGAEAWPRPPDLPPQHRPSADHRSHQASVHLRVQSHHRSAPHHPPRSHTVWRRHTVSPDTIHVHDGDTFYTGAETIRLRGIDTPELGQPKSVAATRRLIALLHEGPVTIVPRAEDVYGRTVADVYVRGHNVSEILRSEGFQKPRPH